MFDGFCNLIKLWSTNEVNKRNDLAQPFLAEVDISGELLPHENWLRN